MATGPKRKPALESPELVELKQQIEELSTALLRERADAMNVRRRAEEDKVKMAGYFKVAVIKELLPFIDNFDRALALEPKSNDKAMSDWLQGLSTINKQLWQILDSLGVKRIKTVGEPFDPKYHEAVQMDSSGEGTTEIVTEEVMSGYSMNGEIIRHAMVKVAIR